MAKARKTGYEHYGLPVYETDEGEFAVGSFQGSARAGRAYILDSLWAFKPEFIARYIRGLDGRALESFVKAMDKMQGELSEDAQPIILAMLGGEKSKTLATFVRDAIHEDGLGHFLAPYDGEERRREDVEGLPPGQLAFRVN